MHADTQGTENKQQEVFRSCCSLRSWADDRLVTIPEQINYGKTE